MAEFFVILFKSVSLAMKSEKILRKEGIPHKLIPVPKYISSDCGICIRIHSSDIDEVRSILEDKAEVENICKLETKKR